ncbi:hypothetical protein AUO94_10935 [Planococcus kocurii]|uniref:Uncharacterized protein n=1 Tax=Planococcus kocurii TaxID=1374 RepID=A0ABM5WXV2_9BACL|nr:hypothetical protein [Planococcus kocurii]ALS79146.1 hypothetical protein AUO94_10935 [Planococcus kocurii]
MLIKAESYYGEQYKLLIEELYDQLADLMAEKRLLTENISTFSVVEVRGAIATASPVIDEGDGWE